MNITKDIRKSITLQLLLIILKTGVTCTYMNHLMYDKFPVPMAKQPKKLSPPKETQFDIGIANWKGLEESEKASKVRKHKMA